MVTNEIIKNWLEESQSMMIDNYESMGFRASGDWPNSLENSVEEKNYQYVGRLLGANYTFWMENGRKPGKFPPKDIILIWIEQKPIQSEINKNSLAFLIARKIAQKGTNARPGLVSNVITDARIQQLFKDIGVNFVDQVRSDVIKTFKG